MSASAAESIARAAGGSWLIPPAAGIIDFQGVSINSRELRPGQGFFAFVGATTDGHRYLSHAADAGAGFCVITDADAIPEGFSTPTLLVEDPLVSLTMLARWWRGQISARVIAITGSNGKTTTCRIMHALTCTAGQSSVSIKSFNNALGVPITILNTPLDAAFLIAEVGTSTPGEIAQRTELLKPDLCLITSIGSAHLEALGSLGGVANEKADLIRCAPLDAVGFFHTQAGQLEASLKDDPHRCSILGTAERFEITDSSPDQTQFRIDEELFTVPMPGRHNAYNAGLCVLAARHLGLSDQQIHAGLASVTPPPMRFERVQILTHSEPITVINDAYNANPDSMRAALKTFSQLDLPQPRIAVLGEMLELGTSSDHEHADLVRFAASLEGIDRVYALGARYPEPAADSIESLADLIEPGQSVLIKGSRGVELERLIAVLTSKHRSSRSDTWRDPSGRA